MTLIDFQCNHTIFLHSLSPSYSACVTCAFQAKELRCWRGALEGSYQHQQVTLNFGVSWSSSSIYLALKKFEVCYELSAGISMHYTLFKIILVYDISCRLVITNLIAVSNKKSHHVPYRDSKLTFLLQVICKTEKVKVLVVVSWQRQLRSYYELKKNWMQICVSVHLS